METKVLLSFIKVIEEELGKGVHSYSKAQVEKLRKEIGGESSKAVETAFDYLILNFNGLPTPQKLIDAVRTEAAKHRERSWSDEKKELAKPLMAATEFAKMCKDVIMQFFPEADEFGKIPKPVYKNILADAQAIAIRYPGSDWPNIFHDWQQQWIAENKLT